MDNKIILRTYGTVWRYEVKIYAFDRFRLIVPISPSELIYFALGFLFMILLGNILPLVNHIPFIVRLVLIPYFLMKFMTKKKLDGKMPHKFFAGVIEYKLLPKRIARFKPDTQPEKVKLGAMIPYRRYEVIDVTKEAIGSA